MKLQKKRFVLLSSCKLFHISLHYSMLMYCIFYMCMLFTFRTLYLDCLFYCFVCCKRTSLAFTFYIINNITVQVEMLMNLLELP